MGIRSSLVVRLGSTCLADPLAHQPELQNLNNFYAMSSTLAPTVLPLHSHVIYPHPAIEKHGVLSEQPHIFKPDPIPENVRTFLEQMQTIVVTISSFGQVKNVAKMFPASCEFQVLFLGSSCQSDPDPSHMHYKGMLDLDMVFQKAALIVHGCGVGTVHQVALSGKPSIGLSGLLEQECNGVALEKMRVSKHFTLRSLYSDPCVVKAFIEAVMGCIQGAASFIDRHKLLEVQEKVQKEHGAAFGAFTDRVRKVLQQP
mmetsp:Transcript_83414/g.165556  ORF Transcript_83414/g.165556 Transcript_83414/m.165556 type:complete len:257 (-) Transcript_83414:240-1010(-)